LCTSLSISKSKAKLFYSAQHLDGDLLLYVIPRFKRPALHLGERLADFPCTDANATASLPATASLHSYCISTTATASPHSNQAWRTTNNRDVVHYPHARSSLEKSVASKIHSNFGDAFDLQPSQFTKSFTCARLHQQIKSWRRSSDQPLRSVFCSLQPSAFLLAEGPYDLDYDSCRVSTPIPSCCRPYLCLSPYHTPTSSPHPCYPHPNHGPAGDMASEHPVAHQAETCFLLPEALLYYRSWAS
jgi:hypothetical protein